MEPRVLRQNPGQHQGSFASLPPATREVTLAQVAGLPCTFGIVRAFGVLLFLAASAGTGYAIRAAFQRSRPADVVFAVLAPIAALVALIGLLLVFVPDFFG